MFEAFCSVYSIYTFVGQGLTLPSSILGYSVERAYECWCAWNVHGMCASMQISFVFGYVAFCQSVE